MCAGSSLPTYWLIRVTRQYCAVGSVEISQVTSVGKLPLSWKRANTTEAPAVLSTDGVRNGCHEEGPLEGPRRLKPSTSNNTGLHLFYLKHSIGEIGYVIIYIICRKFYASLDLYQFSVRQVFGHHQFEHRGATYRDLLKARSPL